MSAFTSIQEAAKSVLGWGWSLAAYLVNDTFKNLEEIAKSKCPCFLLHGVLDTLIPYQHSQALNRQCPQESFLHLAPEMDHNKFQLMTDLINPFRFFLMRFNAQAPR